MNPNRVDIYFCLISLEVEDSDKLCGQLILIFLGRVKKRSKSMLEKLMRSFSIHQIIFFLIHQQQPFDPNYF